MLGESERERKGRRKSWACVKDGEFGGVDGGLLFFLFLFVVVVFRFFPAPYRLCALGACMPLE